MKHSFVRRGSLGFFTRRQAFWRRRINPILYLLLVFLLGACFLISPVLRHSHTWASKSFPSYQQVDSPVVDFLIRNYPFSVLQLTITTTTVPPFDVTLVGPARDTLYISPLGAADDSDADGLDDAALTGPYFYLNGMSKYGAVNAWVLYGHPVWGSLNPQGQLEETVNTTPGLLDAPPYTPTGSLVGVLDLYVGLKIQNLHLLGDNRYYTKFPIRVQGNFNHSQPQAGDTYFNQNSSALFNIYGSETPLQIMNFDYTPVPFTLTDLVFSTASGRVLLSTPNGDLDIPLVGNAEFFLLTGSDGAAADPDANGLDQVPQIMHTLVLTGTSQTPPVVIRLRPPDKSPYQASWGQVEERVNNHPGILDLNPFVMSDQSTNWLSNGGTADSFFDVFFTIELSGGILHNAGGLKFNGIISHLTPSPGESFASEFELPLYDEDNNLTRNILKEMVFVPTSHQTVLPLLFR